MNKIKHNNVITIIIISIIFGFMSGITGELFVRAYFNKYNVTQFNNAIPDNYPENSKIIIEKPSKINIEQTKQIKNVIKSSSQKIVGIFKKKKISKYKNNNDNIINLDNYYNINTPLEHGLIITSDGWVIMNPFTSNIADSDIINNYIAITNDKKIYTIDKVKCLENVLFIHMVNAKELQITKIEEEENIKKGELVILLDKDNNANISYIANKTNKHFIESSDQFSKEILLNNNKNSPPNSFLFNMSGGLVGMSNNNGEIDSINNFKFQILSLLDKNEDKKPIFGIKYIDLSVMASATSTIQKKGALVYSDKKDAIDKNSIADSIGIKEGDIITFIDNKEINEITPLNYILQDYRAGDTLDITYIRNKVKKIISITIQ